MAKIAVISLTCRLDDGTPSATLERELRESLNEDERISSKWFVEKVTILDDTELTESSQIAD